jgi:hypothetical protein
LSGYMHEAVDAIGDHRQCAAAMRNDDL